MAFPTYPAVTFDQAISLSVYSANQLHQILNGANDGVVAAEDGDILTVRHALQNIQDLGGNQFKAIFTDQNIITQTYRTYMIDVSAVPLAVTLPSAPEEGQYVQLVDYTSSAATNNITVSTADGKLIDGSASYVIANNLSVIVLWFDGVEWKPTGELALAGPVASFDKIVPYTSGSYVPVYYDTVAQAKAQTDLVDGMVIGTKGYSTGWAAFSVPSGGAVYQVATLDDVRAAKDDVLWVPDEIGDHTLTNGLVAMLQQTNGRYNVYQFGARPGAGNEAIATAGIQACLDRGGYVELPVGSWEIDDTLSLTVANTEFVGVSKVGSILGAKASLTTLGTHNSLITVDVQPYNGSINNMRMKTFGAYTGWGVTAGASINGFNGFSITMNDLWCDFATSAGGFYRGGLYDCFVTNMQIDVVKTGFNITDGGNRSFIDNVNANGLFGPLIINTSLANNMVVSNIVASGHVGNALVAGGNLFDITNAAKWKIHDVVYNYGNGDFDPTTSYNTFARITNSDIDFSNITMHSNWGVSRATGFYIDTSTVTIDNFNLTKPSNDPTRALTPFNFTGVNEITVDGGRIQGGGVNSQVELLSCGGNISFNGTKLLESTSKSFRSSGVGTFNLYVKNCDILDGYYGVATAANQSLIQLDSTGDIIFNYNRLGISKEAFGTFTDVTGDTDGATGVITGMTSTSGLLAGDTVSVSAGFPAATLTVVSVDSSTQITLDVNSTSAQTNVTVTELNKSGLNEIWDIDTTSDATSTEFNTYQNVLYQQINHSTNKPIATTLEHSILLDDEEVTYLPQLVQGVLTVSAGTEAGVFVVDAAANTTEKISGTANTVNTNTDTKFCVYGASGIIRISNRLGIQHRVTVSFRGM